MVLSSGQAAAEPCSLGAGSAPSAVVSIRHLKASSAERPRRQERVRLLKARLAAAGLPGMANPGHIVPILIGDPVLAKRITDALLERSAIYMQPINYPTVARQ
jgi:5-aminolevulinate synthase